MNWLRLILIGVAVLLFGWAAYAIWCAVNNPAFWSSAIAWTVAAISSAVLPVVLKRKPPEAEAADGASYRRGEDRTPGAHGHGGEH
jgi:hypothetical protein